MISAIARVLQGEQEKGLAFMRALTPEQQQKATIEPGRKAANKAQAHGLRAAELNDSQRALLRDLIGEYVGHMGEGHAKVRMQEVDRHLSDTRFSWIGEVGPEAVFYYRVHNPVILIEFDHQMPVAMKGPKEPGRFHIHTVVRTPNGNDYGKDLLRQHLASHKHAGSLIANP